MQLTKAGLWHMWGPSPRYLLLPRSQLWVRATEAWAFSIGRRQGAMAPGIRMLAAGLFLWAPEYGTCLPRELSLAPRTSHRNSRVAPLTPRNAVSDPALGDWPTVLGAPAVPSVQERCAWCSRAVQGTSTGLNLRSPADSPMPASTHNPASSRSSLLKPAGMHAKYR